MLRQRVKGQATDLVAADAATAIAVDAIFTSASVAVVTITTIVRTKAVIRHLASCTEAAAVADTASIWAARVYLIADLK